METEGYCIVEDLFTPGEMATIAESIETYQRRHEAAIAAQGGVEGISRANEITFTSHLAEHDPDIMAFCRRPEMVAVVTEFLGPDADLYWNQSVYKMPEGYKEFPWHQDDGYTPVDPSPYLTLWIALNDATPENGCISVLPGSYKRGLQPHERTPIGLACHPADDPDQGVMVPLKCGSVAVFWSLTMHKSGANVSNGTRKAYIVQYSKAGLKRADTGELIQNLTPVARGGVGVAEECS
jgi:ectoine hydroxylase-related dioxygenase (phytanoyl-CoA dioxygenase family)